MFDKSLYDDADPDLVAAEAAAGAELAAGVATLYDPHAKADPDGAALAAWSLVHGFSTLWLNEAIDTEPGRPDGRRRANRPDAVRRLIRRCGLLTLLVGAVVDGTPRKCPVLILTSVLLGGWRTGTRLSSKPGCNGVVM